MSNSFINTAVPNDLFGGISKLPTAGNQMKRRLKISITKIRRQMGTNAQTFFRGVCPVCRQKVEMLNCAESMKILQIEHTILEALIAAGKLHTIETASDNRRVCKESLLNK